MLPERRSQDFRQVDCPAVNCVSVIREPRIVDKANDDAGFPATRINERRRRHRHAESDLVAVCLANRLRLGDGMDHDILFQATKDFDIMGRAADQM